MPQIDLRSRNHGPISRPTAQPDLDAFWQRTLAESSQAPLNAKLEKLDIRSTTLTCTRSSSTAGG